MCSATVRAGRELFDQGMLHLAAHILGSATDPSPIDRWRAAEALFQIDDLEGAAPLVIESWRGGYLRSGNLLSSTLLQLGREAELRRHLGDALDQGVSVPTHRLLGVVAASAGDEEEAIGHFLDAAHAGDPEVHSSLGDLYRARGDIDRARRSYRRGAGLGDWRAQEGLGHLALADDPELAAEIFLDLAVDGHVRGVRGYALAQRILGNDALAEAALRDCAWTLWEAAEDLVRLLVETEREGEARDLIESLSDEYSDEWARQISASAFPAPSGADEVPS